MADGKISQIYESIFDKDPLLLLDDNQTLYGDAMLQHLLVYRPLTTSTPHPVDPLKDDAAVIYERQAASLVRPPKDVTKRYIRARRSRDPISRGDFDALKHVTMVADGELTKRRRFQFDGPLPGLPTHTAAEDGLDDLAKKDFRHRLRIAAVGYRLKVSLVDNTGFLSEELCALPGNNDARVPRLKERATNSQLGRTRLRRGKHLVRWEDSILRHLEKALDRHCAVIVMPEFALPIDRKQKDAKSIVERIHEMCQQKEANDYFLFAGTRHEERYNRGLIVSKRKGKLSNVRWHYKVASARGLGENILGPFRKSLPSYRSSLKLRQDTFITVAICYDAYDVTTFLNIVLEAADGWGKKSKIILVPSFNRSKDFVALLRDISFLARCPLIYVNALHGDAKMFVCGYALSDFAIQENFNRLLQSIDDQLKSLPDASNDLQPGWQSRQHNAEYNIEMQPPADWWGNEPPNKKNTLDKLRERLQRWSDTGRLNNMFTLEECEKCENDKNKHQSGDRHCGRDLLYYNIDLELIEALTEFRRLYYGDESFLPNPLQYKALKTAIVDLLKK
jgi:hypothetical protein